MLFPAEVSSVKTNNFDIDPNLKICFGQDL